MNQKASIMLRLFDEVEQERDEACAALAAERDQVKKLREQTKMLLNALQRISAGEQDAFNIAAAAILNWKFEK
jgi:hypothetical protein